MRSTGLDNLMKIIVVGERNNSLYLESTSHNQKYTVVDSYKKWTPARSRSVSPFVSPTTVRDMSP